MGNLFTKEKSNDNSCRPSRGSHEYPRQQERPSEPEKTLPEANPVPSAADKPEEPKIWSGTAETVKTPENEKPSFAPETTKNKSASGSIKNISKSSSRQSVKLSTSTSKHSKIELEELSVKDLPLTGSIAQDSNFRKSPSEKSFSAENPSIPPTPEKQQIPSVLGNLSQSSSRKSLRSSKPTTPLDAPNSPFRNPNGNKSQSPLVKSPSATSPLASPGSPASQKSGNLFGSLIKSPSATSPLVESKTESSAVAALQELVRSSSNTGSLGSASQSVTNELTNVSPSKEENAENNSVSSERGELIDAPLEPASLETAAEPVLDGKIDDAPVDSQEELEDMQQLPKSTSKSSLKSQSSATESQTHISNSGSQKSIRSSKSQNFENLSKSSSKKNLRSSTSNQDFTTFSKSDSAKLLSVLAEGETTQETSQNLVGNKVLSMSKSSSKKSLRSQKSTSSSANRVISPTLSEEPQSIPQDVPYSLSKSSSKKSIAGKSDNSLKIDEILPEREDIIQQGGNPFGEISKMNSAPPCEVYDGSAIKERFYDLKIEKKEIFNVKSPNSHPKVSKQKAE